MAVIGKRFRKHHARRKWRLPAIIAICLGGAILLTVLVGNLLRVWLDDETYDRLTSGEREKNELPLGESANARRIHAYPFVLGEEMETVGGMPAVTVLLNQADGTMTYTSDMTEYLGLSGKEGVLLHEELAELSVFTSYVSGLFYPRAFEQDSPDVRYAKGVQESALLREFARAGGDEIVLCGLPLTASDAESVCEYIASVKYAVGNVPVGVAVDFADGALDSKWEILTRIEQSCDFFVLDLRQMPLDPTDVDDAGISPSAEALMHEADYYLTAYSMRPLLSKEQTGLQSTLEMRLYPNYQISTE